MPLSYISVTLLQGPADMLLLVCYRSTREQKFNHARTVQALVTIYLLIFYWPKPVTGPNLKSKKQTNKLHP